MASTATNFSLIFHIDKKRTWSQPLCSFHDVKAFALPCLSKRATPKAPRMMYVNNLHETPLVTMCQAAIMLIYVLYIPRGVLVALFLTDSLKLRSSYIVKTKA